MSETTQDKIQAVLEHIQNVQRNCYRLGLKLIKSGEIELGRILIANGQIHDNSKFKGIEFENLCSGDSKLPMLLPAIKHHSATNAHHPEYWGSIHKMPEVYIAEMVCDCAARSSEFGTDLRKWIAEIATSKYGFEMNDNVGMQLTRFIDMLLAPPFK